MLDGDLVLGPVTGAYYSLFKKEISNIPTVTPSLFNQTRRFTRHNVSVTRYKSVTKNGHDWSPASICCSFKKQISDSELHGLLMLPGKAKFVSCSIISLGLSF